MDPTSTIPTFYTAPPTIQGRSRASTSILPGSGAISGGLLRPGAIDQAQFKAMLQASQAAQTPGALPPAQPNQAGLPDGIPTLTPAQFAVLTGSQAEPSPTIPRVAAAAPEPQPAAAPTEVSGLANPAAQPEPKSEAGAKSAPASKPATAEDDPRVVHFKRMPDKDERKALAQSGKRWVVDETPGSRKLFFGDDEKFGWDDFVDLINPLQHIPVVAQIYRAATGDEINGAAELLGALPFGPTSFLSGVADLAVRESTGEDMGSHVIAMLFGGGDAPADPGMADAGDPSKTAPGIQTAAIDPGPVGRINDRDNGGHDG